MRSKMAVTAAVMLALSASVALGQTKTSNQSDTHLTGHSEAGTTTRSGPDDTRTMNGSSDRNTDIQLEALQKAATRAQSHLAATPQDRMALIRAVKAGNIAEVKSLLVKAGFSANQAAESKLTFHNMTGGGAPSERTAIHITIRCCPPEIIIEIKLA